MTGIWTKKDQEYWDKPQNRLLFEFKCLFTSKNYWELNPDNSKKMDEDLRKLFKDFLESKANRVEPVVSPKIAWTKEKPDHVGLFYRSNPALQQQMNQQVVFKMYGELWTYHPQNDSSSKTKIKDMPDEFWWVEIPIPEHWDIKLDYDK